MLKVRLNYKEIEKKRSYFTLYPTTIDVLKNHEKKDGYIELCKGFDNFTKETIFFIHEKYFPLGVLPLCVDNKYILEVL